MESSSSTSIRWLPVTPMRASVMQEVSRRVFVFVGTRLKSGLTFSMKVPCLGGLQGKQEVEGTGFRGATQLLIFCCVLRPLPLWLICEVPFNCCLIVCMRVAKKIEYFRTFAPRRAGDATNNYWATSVPQWSSITQKWALRICPSGLMNHNECS